MFLMNITSCKAYHGKGNKHRERISWEVTDVRRC